jgi:hypothetical protein
MSGVFDWIDLWLCYDGSNAIICYVMLVIFKDVAAFHCYCIIVFSILIFCMFVPGQSVGYDTVRYVMWCWVFTTTQ